MTSHKLEEHIQGANMQNVGSVSVPALNQSVSSLGFGCASLGSRIGSKEGLIALSRAFEAGVTWFDVAPSYGDGEAEIYLGSFLKGVRADVQVCTKVGIQPAKTPWLMKQIKPIARAAIGAIPALRKMIATNRPMAEKIPLSPELILTSAENSLRRLRTDYLDVLALHGATEGEVCDDAIVSTLDRLVKSGMVRAIAVASSLSAGMAAIKHSSTYGIVQVANNPFEPNIETGLSSAGGARPITFVGHTTYGFAGALERVGKFLESNQAALIEANDKGFMGTPEKVASSLLAAYALGVNRQGVTVMSMFKAAHLKDNIDMVRFASEWRWVKAFLEKNLQ